MIFLVLLFSFFLHSDLLAQESGSQYIERQERVESFVEFVGLLGVLKMLDARLILSGVLS